LAILACLRLKTAVLVFADEDFLGTYIANSEGNLYNQKLGMFTTKMSSVQPRHSNPFVFHTCSAENVFPPWPSWQTLRSRVDLMTLYRWQRLLPSAHLHSKIYVFVSWTLVVPMRTQILINIINKILIKICQKIKMNTQILGANCTLNTKSFDFSPLRFPPDFFATTPSGKSNSVALNNVLRLTSTCWKEINCFHFSPSHF
jgi:hypothetical protein